MSELQTPLNKKKNNSQLAAQFKGEDDALTLEEIYRQRGWEKSPAR